jgi:oligopeptide transport system ATP-binding protein
MRSTLVEVEGLTKTFRKAGMPSVQAIRGVSFSIYEGEILGLVGESGSGKSTAGRCVGRLLRPTSGAIRLDGVDIAQMSERELRPRRSAMNMVFQDPQSSLNPRMTVGSILVEPLIAQGRVGRNDVIRTSRELLEMVRMDPDIHARYPHELSGGQRQRIALARAISTQPRLLIADEPTSALDVSVRGAIGNLILDLRAQFSFSALFITHDIELASLLCDRIAVIYLGRIVEIGLARELVDNPLHPYSQALVSAVPIPDPVQQRARKRIVLSGVLSSSSNPPPGCAFHTRCPIVKEVCRTTDPTLRSHTPSSPAVACHLVGQDGTAPTVISDVPPTSINH